MSQDPTRESSPRLGALSDGQLQAALDRFGLGALLRAEPVPIGLFGQNVFLTSTTGNYVLRGSPGTDRLLPKEQFFIDLFHERTEVPVPWPYMIDPTQEIFGWSYAIMPRMPGLQIGDPALRSTVTPADRRHLARAMGENLARMQELTWPHHGVYDPETGDIRPSESTFCDWFVARVRHWLDRCRAASAATSEQDVAWVEREVIQARPALSVPFLPAFVHQDYKENNAVAQRTADGWRVTGVFDMGKATLGMAKRTSPVRSRLMPGKISSSRARS